MGSERSSSSTRSAWRSSSIVSSSGTKPTFVTPASRASTAAANTSSAPRHMETMYDSIDALPYRSCASRIASKVEKVRRPASSSGGGWKVSGRFDVSSRERTALRSPLENCR